MEYYLTANVKRQVSQELLAAITILHKRFKNEDYLYIFEIEPRRITVSTEEPLTKNVVPTHSDFVGTIWVHEENDEYATILFPEDY